MSHRAEYIAISLPQLSDVDTLIYTHQWIELHVQIDSDQQQACSLKRMLFDGLKHAAEVQKYNITPEVAFLCPHEQEEPSQAAEESQPSSLPPHLATVTRNKQRIRCKLDKRISMPFGSHTLQANQPSPMLQQTMKTVSSFKSMGISGIIQCCKYYYA